MRVLSYFNLGKLAYHIEKGDIDPSKPITMKHLLEGGVVSKIKHGVKLLAKGAHQFKNLGLKIDLEVSDATMSAIKYVKDLGGTLKCKYRTPLLIRYHTKPHKFDDYKELKTPMPPPKQVKKLEKIREKGIDVDYPRAPWFTDNMEQLKKEAEEREKRMNESQYAELLP